ncbi:MAG: hypothetical protein AAF609_19830 [Cyanobacteria bacterium P01_C01_bin.120]
MVRPHPKARSLWCDLLQAGLCSLGRLWSGGSDRPFPPVSVVELRGQR